ncbi:MAG: hypothetical protein IJW37_03530 [Lachnospiraceae bacterium]|nr:hypothetical protein [Lachnospiraceae bacterium]
MKGIWMKEKRNRSARKAVSLWLLCSMLLGVFGCALGSPVTAYAETETVTEESQDATAVATDGTTTGQQVEVRPFTFRDWFGLVFCCALGIGVCLWVALYGDPKERERLRNKKIKKQMEQEALMKAVREEKKRKEAEEAARLEAEAKAAEEEQNAK